MEEGDARKAAAAQPQQSDTSNNPDVNAPSASFVEEVISLLKVRCGLLSDAAQATAQWSDSSYFDYFALVSCLTWAFKLDEHVESVESVLLPLF